MSAVDALPEECVACVADLLASHGRDYAPEGVHDGWYCNACGEAHTSIVGTRYTREEGEGEEATTYDLCHEHFEQLGAEMKALYKLIPPPDARPISRMDATDRLRDLQTMSLVCCPWQLAVTNREDTLWMTLTLARFPRAMGIVREQGPPRCWKQLFLSQEVAERPPPRRSPAVLDDFIFTVEPYVGPHADPMPVLSPLVQWPFGAPTMMPQPCWTGDFSTVAEMAAEPPTLWTREDAGIEGHRVERYNRMRVLVTWGSRTACIYDGGEDRRWWSFDAGDLEEKELPCHKPLGENEFYDRMLLSVRDPRFSDGEANLIFGVRRYDHHDPMTDAELLRYLTEGLPWELLTDRAPPWEQTGAASMYAVPTAEPVRLTDFVFTIEVFSRSKAMQAAFDRNRSSSSELATAPFEEEEADEPSIPPSWVDKYPEISREPYTVDMDDESCALLYPQKMVSRWTGTFSDAKDMVRSYGRLVGGQMLPPHPVERAYPRMWDTRGPEWMEDVALWMDDTHELRRRILVTWREHTFCLQDAALCSDDISALPCNMGSTRHYEDKAKLHATFDEEGEIMLGFAIDTPEHIEAMTEAQILSYLTQGVPWQQVKD